MSALQPDAADLLEPSALGVVVEAGRGSLPFALIHGESLVACAAWALGDAGVTVLDASVAWSSIREAEQPLVLHDPLCPMTPSEFLATCVRTAVAEDVVVVGVRPVTDTVKVVAHGRVGATLDRSGLVGVCAPIVLPAGVCAALAAPPLGRFAEVVAGLSGLHALRFLEAPPAARRVASADDLRLVEALTAPTGTTPG